MALLTVFKGIIMAESNGITLFGFEIKRKQDRAAEKLRSIVPPTDEDGAGYVLLLELIMANTLILTIIIPKTIYNRSASTEGLLNILKSIWLWMKLLMNLSAPQS